MKASVAAVGVFAAVASAHSPRHFHWNRRALNETASETTLTVSVTQVSTIISCAPTVTNCPAKQTDIANLPESAKTTAVVTQTVPLYTTVCPVSDASSIASSLINEHISSNAPVLPSSTFPWSNSSAPAPTGAPITSGSPNQPSLTTSVIPIVTDVPTTIIESGLAKTTTVKSTFYSTVTVPCSSASGITSAPGTGNGNGNGNGDNDITSTSTSTTTGTTTLTVSAPGGTESNNSPSNGGNNSGNGGNNGGNGNNSGSGDCVASTVTVTAPASTVYVTIGGDKTSTGAGAGQTSTGAGSVPTGTQASSAPTASPTGGNSNNGGNNGGNGGNNGSDDDECDDDDTQDDDECDDDEGDDDECPPESTTTLSATVTVPFPTGNGTQPTPTGIFPTGGFAKLRR